MGWWVWLLLVGAIWLAVAVASRKKQRILHLTIELPETGLPTLQFAPSAAKEHDVALMTLCYGSKIWWLLQNEPEAIREIFREFCAEAIDFWDRGSGSDDLIDRLPTAAAVRALTDAPKAVAGGECFRVSLYQDGRRIWITSWLPRPGLVANLPWSFMLLLNVAYVFRNDRGRRALHRAFEDWFDAVVDGGPLDTSTAGLSGLFKASQQALENALQADGA